MATLSVTLQTLVNRAQLDLVDAGGQGKRVVMGANALADASDTTFELVDGASVSITDVIEFEDELVLITDKSADAVPVFTCSRGYFNSAAVAHSAGTPGHVNPTYPRVKIAEAIRRSFTRLEALGVPLIKSVTKSRVAGFAYVEMPADTRDVLDVLYWGEDGKLYHITRGWEFFDYLPTGKFSTGKAINLPKVAEDEDEFEVIYRAPYRWSTHPADPLAASTIDIPEGAEDLPALYAAAFLVSSREISRAEIDRAQEWTETAPIGQGSTGALVRARWQEFYRALDEARRLAKIPQPILVRPRSRL